MNVVIRHFGSKAKLAQVLGVSPAAVSYWLRAGLPPARAIQIERLTDGRLLAKDISGVRADAA